MRGNNIEGTPSPCSYALNQMLCSGSFHPLPVPVGTSILGGALRMGRFPQRVFCARSAPLCSARFCPSRSACQWGDTNTRGPDRGTHHARRETRDTDRCTHHASCALT